MKKRKTVFRFLLIALVLLVVLTVYQVFQAGPGSPDRRDARKPQAGKAHHRGTGEPGEQKDAKGEENNYLRELRGEEARRVEELARLSAWLSPGKKVTPDEAKKRLQRAAGQVPETGKKERRRTIDELLAQLHVKHEVVVRFKDKAGRKQMDAVLARLNPVKTRKIRVAPREDAPENRIYHLKLAESMSVREGLKILLTAPCVRYAEPNYILFPALVPDDPYYSSSGTWGNSYPDLWGVHKMECNLAWEVSTGSGVVVAVTDTGVDLNHEDLAGNIWTNPGEIPDNGIDDDSNAFVDDVHGWDFVQNDNDPTDTHGHGTHVAGTIAAVGNNARGIVGVAFNAKIMAVRGLGTGGSGTEAGMADCIYYAANNGAKVINASWGAPGYSYLIRDAINYAYGTCGCIFVAAAGNDNMDASGFYPAAHPSAITVAASDPYDQKAYFSNWGSKLDVAAPGVNILSCRAAGTSMGIPIGSTLTRAQGTSMAAPHVSGLCALILADNPSLEPEEVRQVIRDSADDIGDPGFDIYFGYGRVNANAALGSLTDNGVANITSPTLNETVQGTITVAGTATADNFADYVLEYGLGSVPSAWTTLTTSTVPVSNGTLYAGWDTTAVSDDYYTLRLRVSSTFGREFVDAVGFEIHNAPGPSYVTVTPGTATIRVGETIQFTATTTGAVDSSYTWMSSKDGVATVDSDGEATGISVGSTTITATGDQTLLSGNATLNVVEPYVEVTPPVSYLAIGGSVDLDAVTHDSIDNSYAWSSADTSVATVDGNGFVSAVGAGYAIIYATGDVTGCSGSAEVHVSAPHIDINCAAVKMLSSADSSHMYVLSYSTEEVLSVNAQTRAVDSTVPVAANPTWMDTSEDFSKICVANSGAGSISVIDTGSFSVVDTIATPTSPLYLACGKGDFLYFSADDSADRNLYMANAATHTVTPVVTFGAGSRFKLSTSADRSKLFVAYSSGNNESTIEKFDISAGTPVAQAAQKYDDYVGFAHPGPGDILVMHGDAYFGYHANVIRPGDLHRLAQMKTWHIINGAAFCASHNLVFVSSGANRKLQCFDLATFMQVDIIELEEIVSSGVGSVQKDPLATTLDGKYLFAILDHDPFNQKDRLQVIDISTNNTVLISPPNCHLSAGVTYQLAADTISGIDTGYAWSSTNPAIVTVDASGLVTAAAPGTAEISARGDVSGSERRCTLQVNDPAKDRWFFNVGTRLDTIVADPVRERMYCSNIYGNKLLVIDTENPAVIKEIFVGSHPSGLAVAEDGATLYIAVTGSQKIVTVDLASLTVSAELDLDFCPGKIALYGPQKLVAASETKSSSQNLYTVDLGTGAAASFDSSRRVERLIVSCDKTKLYVLHAAIAQGFMEYDLTVSAPVLLRDASSVEYGVVDMALTQDAARMCIACGDLKVFSIADLSLMDSLTSDAIAVALNGTGDRAFIAVGGFYYDYLHVVDISETLFQVDALKSAQKLGERGLCLSHDETKIAAIGDPDTGHFDCDCIEVFRLPGSPRLGAVEGYVQEMESGSPISGVKVKIEQGAFSRTVYTDENGYFRITELEPGSYRITFSKDGYVEVVQVNVGVEAGSVTLTTLASMELDILKITTSAVPTAYIGTLYTAALEAIRGQPPYTWARSSGSLSPGIGINPDGTITGTPTLKGVYHFTVRVTDAAMAQATKSLSLCVRVPRVIVNSVSPQVLGPTVTSSTIDWQSEADGTYCIEVGGDGTPGSGLQVGAGTCFADTPVNTEVDETDIQNNTTQNVFIIIDTGSLTFSSRAEVTDDHTGPDCEVTSPSDGSVRGSATAVRGIATDLGGSIPAYVEICISDGTDYYDPGSGSFDSSTPVWIPATSGASSWYYDSSAVPWVDLSAYTIRCTATDAVGNSGPPGPGATFTLNSAVPTVTVNSVSHRVVGPAQSSTINWVSDVDGTYHVEVAGTGTPGTGLGIASGACLASVGVDTTVLESYIPDNGALAVWVIVEAGANVGNEAVLLHDDHTLPGSTVSQPADGAELESVDMVAGKASDTGGSSVAIVEVALFNGASYYNPGTGDFTSPSAVWLPAQDTTSWLLYTSTVPWKYEVAYIVRSRATDAVGNVETPNIGNTFVFTGNPPSEEDPPKKKSGGGCALVADGSREPALAPVLILLVLLGVLVVLRRFSPPAKSR